MNRIVSFAIFMSIALSIYFLMHFVVYKVLVKYLPFFTGYKKWLGLFLLLSGLSFPLTIFLSRSLKLHLLNYYAYIWLGVISIAFFVLLVDWLLVKIIPGSSQLLTAIALILIGAISIFSLVNGLQLPSLKKITIPLKNLPKELDGFTIVQVSDLHLEPFKSKRVITSVVKKVNSLQPDLVVLTGDLIEGDEICQEAHFLEQIKKLHARCGVLAITGNHEFYAGIETFSKLAQKANIRLLRNQKIEVAGALQIIGLDDDTGKRFSMAAADLDALIKECDQAKPIILLYHRPTGFDQAAAKGVDLQLSGHTHAGQIPPMDILVYCYYKYPAGLYERNGAYIYTSSGAGYWGPPMRFLSRSEIVHITLRCARDFLNQ